MSARGSFALEQQVPSPAPSPAPLPLEGGSAALGAILNMMPQIVWSAQPDGHHDFYNDRWYEFTGVPRGSTDGEGWNGLFHPEDQPRAWARWHHCLKTGEPYEIEYRLRRHDGSYRWTLGRALPVRDAGGRIERWYGSVTDIHDRRMAEEQRDLVAGELAHRIRNIFAVVSSLLMLTARSQPESRPFAEDARARVDALSRAHDYINPDGRGRSPDGSAVSIQGLLETLLRPYRRTADDRQIVVDGEDFSVGPTAATSLALVIHELATNAVKHGCLAADAGELRISTSRHLTTASIRWVEQGGPAIVAEPHHRGFGTTLSERALRVPLGATLERQWDPGGLTAGIQLPLDRLAR